MASTTILKFERGEERDERFTVKDSEGVLVDLTGYTFFGTMRDTADETGVSVATWTLGAGIEVDADQPGVGKGLGTMEFRTVQTLQTSKISNGTSYYLDVWATTPAGLDVVILRRIRVLVENRIDTVAT